jgi:predicted metal-dependent hydrolase
MITIRDLGFQFPDDIPFYFNPNNPAFSLSINMFSFLAPAFERYFIRAVAQALPRIEDEALLKEAQLFCHQERMHSQVHIDHQQMLIRKHPELANIRDRVNESYENLLKTESNDFALAYATTIELWFKPSANFFVQHRDALFTGGDDRIYAFFIWHFVEEFEHRHAMLSIYQALVGSYWYRLKTARRTINHAKSLAREIARAIRRCEDLPEGGAAFEKISSSSRLQLTLGLMETLSPFHDPDRGGDPQWVKAWFAAEAAGQDMRTITF